MTKRPPSAGDSVQFQTQWWIERFGFYLPAVMTVPGSRGDVANGLRLDLVIDDQMINCVEVIGAGADQGGADAARTRCGGARATRSAAASASSPRCPRRSPCSSGCTTCIPQKRGRLLRLIGVVHAGGGSADAAAQPARGAADPARRIALLIANRSPMTD